MGNFYVNYTLRGPTQQAVASALAGRSAFVTREQNGCVVAIDGESDSQNQGVITALASRLSRELQCPVLAVLNHDDDVLWYQLSVNGHVLDKYSSSPNYFQPAGDAAPSEGGDAQKLCSAFGASDVAAVENVLRKPDGGDSGYTFAIERHGDLVRALGLSTFAVGAGYRYIARGNVPRALEGADLLPVT